MMRVLLATNSRDRGSTSRTLEAWTRLLPGAGVEPHVTVGGEGPLLEALRAAHVPVRIRGLQILPSARTGLSFGWAVADMVRAIRAAEASLVHINEHEFHMVPVQAARLARVPVVTHLRFKPTPEMCRWIFGRGRMPARLFFTSRTQMADSADAVRPAVPEDRWRLIPNGLDFSVFGIHDEHRQRLRAEWGIDDDTLVVGIACAISERKRVDHVLRLVARLRARGVRVHGVIAGHAHLPSDAAVVEALHRQAADMGLSDVVRFLGYVEPVEPLYYAFDLCVSTSSYETFGMSVIEAMACRCPVLAYPGGAVAEVVGDSAVIVPDGDEDALFDESLRLLGNREALRALGRGGREHAASNYDIRTVVPRLVREYQDVVDSVPARPGPKGSPRREQTSDHPCVLIATNSSDRGSTSRTLEAWTRLLPAQGIAPWVTVGGPGPLESALHAAGVPVGIRRLAAVPDLGNPGAFGLAVARLAAAIRASGASLVHANEHEFHLVPAYAARLCGVPLVTHLRYRPTPEFCRSIFRDGRRPERLFFTSQTQMNDSADAVRPMVPEDRWSLIPDGLDCSTFGVENGHRATTRQAWGIDEDTVAIGIACVISSRKRVDHFIRLIARLRARGQNVKGFIAGRPYLTGDYEVERQLRLQVAEQGLDRGGVEFLGYVEPVEPIYHAWDLSVSTSEYETFGMSVVEAMACSCPLLAYPGRSVTEVIGEAGVVVPDGDEDALLDAAAQMIDDRAALAALGRQGRTRAVEVHDLKMVVPKLVREYRAVLATGRT